MKKHNMDKKYYQFFSMLLCIILVIQPYNMQKAKAASGAVVYGADGTTAYTLDHEYVKQLNINTGSITITDSSYTQTNGATESWDANEDAYVIKGQGTSTNTITINCTSYTPTIYLLETQWSGSIVFNNGNNTAVKVVILGEVTCDTLIKTASTAKNNQQFTVEGFDNNSVLKSKYLLANTVSGGNSYIGYFNIDNLNVESTYVTNTSTNFSQSTYNYNANYTIYLEYLTISNSTINLSTTTNVTANNFYVGTYSYGPTTLIENSNINCIGLSSGGNSNHSPGTTDLDVITISDSNIGTLYTGIPYFRRNLTVSDSYISSIVDSLVTVYSYYYTTSITDSEIINLHLYSDKVTSTDSTVATDLSTLRSAVYLFDHTSFNAYNTGWVLNGTPVDSNANDVFLKKVRFRDNPNTYILTTFPDGHISKLLTDGNGYLYPYIPKGSSELKFQITDETGNANLGNYELTFDPIQANDTTSSEPVTTQLPTTIHTPYKEASIEYSFDNNTWYPVTTDSNGDFQVVIPEGTNRIFIRNSSGETKFAEVSDGSLGVWEDAKPIITAQSNSPISLLKGSEGTLYVVAEPFVSGDTLLYQWVKDGNSIDNATGNILTIPDADDSDVGTYTCIVTESDGKINSSSPIVVTVVDSASNTDELLAQIEDLTNQVNNLQDQLDDANADKNSLEDTIADLQEQITGLNDQINSLQDQIDNLNAELDQSGADKEELNNLIISLNEQITELRQTEDTLEDALSDAQDSNAELLENVNELKATIISLNSQITLITQQLDEMEDENAELLNQIGALNNQIAELMNEIETLNGSLTDLNKDNSELQAQLEAATTTISNLTSIINLIKNELGVSDDEDILTAIQNLKNQLDTEKTINASYLEIINDLQNKLADATASNKELNQKLEELLDLVGADDSDDLLDKIKELQEAITDANNQISVLEQEKTQYQTQLNEANETIVNLQEQIDALLNSGDKTEDELREQILLLTEQINQLQGENRSMADSLTNLNLEITNLRQEKIELEAEIARLESLLDTANSTIEELRQQVADLTAEKTTLSSENNLLQEDNDALKGENAQLKEENDTLKDELDNDGSTNTEIENLKQQLAESEAELAKAEEALKDAKGNTSSGSSSGSIPSDAVVISPADETETDTIIDAAETDLVTGGTIVAEDGWEVASSINDEFGSSLSISDSYANLYSFYDNSLDTSQVSQLSLNKSNLVNVLSLASGIGLNLSETITDKDGYVKYTFYARRTSNPSKIYECSMEVKKSNYLTPITSLTSSVKEVVNNYSIENIYDVEVKGGITFHVDADFGAYGRKEILYQLVPADMDFDPDSNWQTVSGNTITIKKVTEAERLYIKYVDNGNNYTVDKTVGFKPVEKLETDQPGKADVSSPTFNMDKTIYLGYEYQIQLSETDKKSKITYSSSNNKIATVDQDGVITAVSKGKSTITGKVVKGDSTYQYIIQVTITDGKGSPTLNLITPDISSTSDNPVLILYKQLQKNSSTKLALSGISDDAIITYLTSDSSTVTVTKDGTIKGIKKGSADITILVTQGGKHYIYLVKVRVDDGTKDEEMYEYLE